MIPQSGSPRYKEVQGRNSCFSSSFLHLLPIGTSTLAVATVAADVTFADSVTQKVQPSGE